MCFMHTVHSKLKILHYDIVYSIICSSSGSIVLLYYIVVSICKYVYVVLQSSKNSVYNGDHDAGRLL